ncbi:MULTISPECIES: SRPBCC domain-containing protein [Brevundimonas]|uniref:SRPBCC domain-containing protein n=2 Tax=Caulobacteraceae TaxID=76892 RepID=UPI0034D662EF
MKAPLVKTGMLIRRPTDEVYQAFTEPGVTSWFWFTHADRRLTPGAHVTWTWGMYGVVSRLLVKALEPNRRILIEWDLDEVPTEVEWTFEDRGVATWVEITNRGFATSDSGVKAALEAMEGFTLVLAGAKLWLERAIEPTFIIDRFPDQVAAAWKPEV